VYVPEHFREDRLESIEAVIRDHPLATIVVFVEGRFEANHIPLILQSGEHSLRVLQGHVARSNPLAEHARQGAAYLSVFQGGSAYVSPSWYPSKREHGKVVPTWNYVAVHVHGRMRAVDDVVWIRDQMDRLTQQQESQLETPWSIDDAPAGYIQRMAQGVVGIELTIEHIEAKWKTSQNQSSENRAGVIAALSHSNRDSDRHMAEIVLAKNLKKPTHES
jgi:transcriptional regulator